MSTNIKWVAMVAHDEKSKLLMFCPEETLVVLVVGIFFYEMLLLFSKVSLYLKR